MIRGGGGVVGGVDGGRGVVGLGVPLVLDVGHVAGVVVGDVVRHDLERERKVGGCLFIFFFFFCQNIIFETVVRHNLTKIRYFRNRGVPLSSGHPHLSAPVGQEDGVPAVGGVPVPLLVGGEVHPGVVVLDGVAVVVDGRGGLVGRSRVVGGGGRVVRGRGVVGGGAVDGGGGGRRGHRGEEEEKGLGNGNLEGGEGMEGRLGKNDNLYLL